MPGTRERAPFNIVVRQVVNNFQPEISSSSSQIEIPHSRIREADVHERLLTNPEPEAETLFDDSEVPDEPIQAVEAVERAAVPTENKGVSYDNNDNDDDDDAIFSQVETQVFLPRGMNKRALPKQQQQHVDLTFTGDKPRVQPSLDCAFVTAAGKSTKVSYEALQAVKEKLKDTSPPPPLGANSSAAEVDSGSRSDPGDSAKVSVEALPVSRKVLVHVGEPSDLRQKQAVLSGKDPEEFPTIPSTAKLIRTPGSSKAGKPNQTPLLGFSTARGSVQKVSDKALEKVRMMFQKEFPEASGGNGQVEESAEETKAPLMTSGFATARGRSVLVSKENLEKARKVLEEATPNHENGEKLSETPSISFPSSKAEIKVQNPRQERVQDSKTPARRFTGLKRRTPMCQTPLNMSNSPITPLRTPSSTLNSSASTPFRYIQQGKPLTRESRALADIDESGNGGKKFSKTKLTDLTLMDRPTATADSTWFRDDVSGRLVHLEDVKRSFRREIEVRSTNFDSWFANHFEMVVWKLANYSGRLKELAGCLLIENVLDQLKHRWSVEQNGKRSPLRMIVERDAPSEATIVLLVKDVRPTHLILSDGWYSIPCDVDVPLQSIISKGLLRTGQKLCICGAHLKGAPNGVDPLQLENARLSIHYNSTRRARWYAKMGYLRKGLLVPLFSIKLDGGCLPAIRVRVTSCSPLMFFEKFSQGGSIVRAETAERKEQRKYCEKMSSIQEKIREEVLNKLESEQKSKRVTRTRSRPKPSVASLRSGEDIFNALESSLDPAQLIEELSSSQRRMLENYRTISEDKFRERVENETRRRLEEMKQRHECPEERIVAPLLKLMVCCSLSNIEVPLTIWRPSEDLRAMLRIGATVTIYRANVSTCRKSPFGLTTKTNTRFELFEESTEQQRPQKQARLEK